MPTEETDLSKLTPNQAIKFLAEQIWLIGMSVEMQTWDKKIDEEVATGIYSFGVRLANFGRLLTMPDIASDTELLDMLDKVNMGLVRFTESLANAATHYNKEPT